MPAVEETEHEQMVTLNFVRKTETPGAHFAGNCERFKLLLILRVSESFLDFHLQQRYFIKKEAFYKFHKGKRGSHQEADL